MLLYLILNILLSESCCSAVNCVATLGRNDFPVTRGIQAVSEHPLDGAVVEGIQVSEAGQG